MVKRLVGMGIYPVTFLLAQAVALWGLSVGFSPGALLAAITLGTVVVVGVGGCT